MRELFSAVVLSCGFPISTLSPSDLKGLHIFSQLYVNALSDRKVNFNVSSCRWSKGEQSTALSTATELTLQVSWSKDYALKKSINQMQNSILTLFVCWLGQLIKFRVQVGQLFTLCIQRWEFVWYWSCRNCSSGMPAIGRSLALSS